MKKLLNVLLIILFSIVSVLALAFIFIEGRLVLSLEWKVYDNPMNGLVRYLFRLLIAIYCLVVSILEIINIKKKNKVLESYLVVFDISFVVISLVVLVYATNYINLICIVLALLILIVKYLKVRLNGRNYLFKSR